MRGFGRTCVFLFDGKVQIIGGSNDGSMEIYDPLIETIGAYAHVLPESDPCTGLINQILSSQTRAALFYAGSSMRRAIAVVTRLPSCPDRTRRSCLAVQTVVVLS